MGRRNDIDWDAVKRDYRLGRLTDAELCLKHGVSEAGLRPHKKQEGWTRDLSGDVRHATQTALLTGSLPSETAGIARKSGKASLDELAVQGAVASNVRIIKRHRDAADSLMGLAESMRREVAALTGKPVELDKLVQAVREQDPFAARDLRQVLSIHQRISSLDKLTKSLATVVATERVAHGLDDKQAGDRPFEELLARVRGRV